MRRSTSALTVGAAVAGALALSGCQVTSPQQTTVPYQPADGVNITLGDVKVNDLVVITSGKGKEGVLSGQVINNGKREESEIRSETALADFGLFVTVESADVELPTSRVYSVFSVTP